MKSLEKIKNWYLELSLQPYEDYWEFHTFCDDEAKDFVDTVRSLGRKILSITGQNLVVCTLDGNIKKPGWIITCTKGEIK